MARVGFEGSRDLPRCLQRWWLGNRRVAGAGQFRSAPVYRSESPTGYSSAGCSPAEPASASPVTDDSSSIPIQRGDQIRSSASRQGGHHPAFDCDAVALIVSAATEGVISTLRAGCHFYLAPTSPQLPRSPLTPNKP